MRNLLTLILSAVSVFSVATRQSEVPGEIVTAPVHFFGERPVYGRVDHVTINSDGTIKYSRSPDGLKRSTENITFVVAEQLQQVIRRNATGCKQRAQNCAANCAKPIKSISLVTGGCCMCCGYYATAFQIGVKDLFCAKVACVTGCCSLLSLSTSTTIASGCLAFAAQGTPCHYKFLNPDGETEHAEMNALLDHIVAKHTNFTSQDMVRALKDLGRTNGELVLPYDNFTVAEKAEFVKLLERVFGEVITQKYINQNESLKLSLQNA